MDKIRKIIIEAGKVTLEGADGSTETAELVKGALEGGGFEIVPGKRAVALLGLAAIVTIALVMLAACSEVGIQPEKTADGIDGIGVMWVGRKSYRMPCIAFVDWGGDGSRMAWSCDWSRCGPDNECLDGLPDLGAVFGEGE